MKTQILQLERYDDLISACDKLKWAKADRILLIWPARTKILNRKLDLLILKRQSIAQGAQLALVTRDHKIRSLAHQQGIPTFSTIRRAQFKAWRLPRRFRGLHDYYSPVRRDLAEHSTRLQPDGTGNFQKDSFLRAPLRQSPLLRLLFFFLGVMAFLIVAALLYPTAEISLKPATQWQEANLMILPDELIEQVSIDGRVPARKQTVVVEGRDSSPVSGTTLFPDTHATGEVQFTNLTDAPLKIPKGIVVRSTDGQRFEVTSQATLPAGSGERASLTVRCLLPGSAGNVQAGWIGTIEGDLNTFASVTNANPLRSGKDKRMPAATQADRQKLEQNLLDELAESAIYQLQEQLLPGDYLIPGSLQLVETLERTFIPTDDSPSNQLGLSLRLEYQATFIAASDLEYLSNLVLNTSPQENTQIITDSYTYEIAPPSDDNLNKTNNLGMTVRRKTREIIKTSQVTSTIMGLTPEQAQVQLSNLFTLETPAIILLQPDWWPRLPFIPLRITVLVID